MKIKVLFMINTFLMFSSLIAFLVTAYLDKKYWWVFLIIILTLHIIGLLIIHHLETTGE